MIGSSEESWLDVVDNPEQLFAAFGGQVPSLDGIEVRDVLLRFEDPSMTVRLNLADYPSAPPSAWRTRHANTVTAQFTFLPVRDIAATRWGWNGEANLSLARDGDGVRVRVDGPERQLSARADRVLMSVSAYIDERRLER
jgi:hypothetical protein